MKNRMVQFGVCLFLGLSFISVSWVGHEMVTAICLCAMICAGGLLPNKRELSKLEGLTLTTLSFFSVYALIISFAAIEPIRGVAGSSIYLNAGVLYWFLSLKTDQGDKERLTFSLSLAMVGITLFNLMFHAFFNPMGRLSGALGYANTMAILMLYAIFNLTQKNNRFIMGHLTVLSLGLLATASRTTIILWMMLCGIQGLRRKDVSSSLKMPVGMVLGLIGWLILKNDPAILMVYIPLVYVLTDLAERTDSYGKFKLAEKCEAYKNKVIVIIPLMLLLTLALARSRMTKLIHWEGTLAERLIIFSDTLKATVATPIGHGAQQFSLWQFAIQTADYDVKYVHNLFLQMGFDLGIVGLVGAMALLFIGVRQLSISKKTGLSNSQIMLGVLLMHAMMDFDYAFPVWTMILMLTWAQVTSKENSEMVSNLVAPTANGLKSTRYRMFYGLSLFAAATILLAAGWQSYDTSFGKSYVLKTADDVTMDLNRKDASKLVGFTQVWLDDAERSIELGDDESANVFFRRAVLSAPYQNRVMERYKQFILQKGSFDDVLWLKKRMAWAKGHKHPLSVLIEK